MGKTYLWILQLVTGVLIAIFLGIHVVLLHLNDILGATGPTSWVTMIGRSSQGIFVALYIALLAVGLYHGINGLRNLLLEVTKSARLCALLAGFSRFLASVSLSGGVWAGWNLF